MSAFVTQYRLDLHIQEHGERLAYLDSFWKLVEQNQKLAQTERKLKKALVQQDLETFRRQVETFDRPGLRHLLPKYRNTPCVKKSVAYSMKEDEIIARIRRA